MHKEVIVVGAGIAGLRIAKALNATLITNNPDFIFPPRLPDLLTQDTTATIPLTQCHEDVIIDFVERIDTKNKRVHTKKSTYSYDYLVIATGARATKVIPGSKQHAHFFYNLQDVNKLKTTENKRVVVIGAGATGVEVASQLSADNAVILLQAGEDILPGYSRPIRQYARTVLEDEHVRIKCACRVEKITRTHIHTGTEKIPYDICVCAIGVTANVPQGINADKGILVNEYLQVPDAPEVFAAGDCAQTNNPLTAQAAKYEADLVIQNLKAQRAGKRMIKNSFHNKGMFILLSEHVAVDSVLRLYGTIPRFLRNTYYEHLISTYRN